MSDVVTTVGIDIGKTTFHLIGFDGRGAIVLRQKVSRAQLERRFAALPPCLVGMEACCGAHHVGRQLAALGHAVRLIPAQYVKPFVKSNKNDFRDAEASAEAVLRPTVRCVPPTADQTSTRMPSEPYQMPGANDAAVSVTVAEATLPTTPIDVPPHR